MKLSRYFIYCVLLFCVFVRPGNGCSPGDPEAVFVRLNGPDTSYKSYAAGRLGVVLGSYRPRHLVIAFDYLNGRKLTAQEQVQAFEAEKAINWQGYEQDNEAKAAAPASGLAHWLQIAPADVKQPQDTSRKIPGSDYEAFDNCLDDAFTNAAKTYSQRQASYGSGNAEVAAWLRAQSTVFQNCTGTTGFIPEAAPANASLWLKQDRAYQIAAAHFYALQFDEALAGFRAIAADQASPWHVIAPYLVARTLIRQATLTPVDQGSPEKVAANTQLVRDAYSAALRQLDGILRDPGLKAIQPAAQDLRDLVAARAEPAVQAKVLAQRLTEQPHGLDMRHNLVDLTYILNNSTDDNGNPLPLAKELASVSDAAGLLPFLRLLHTPTAAPAPSYYETRQPETAAQTKARLAAQHVAAQSAYKQWQSTQKTTWLMAALALTRPDDPFAGELVSAAGALQPASPAFTGATYYRLRLAATAPATRAEVLTLLPKVEAAESRSTINLFAGLLTRTSPTLTDYLKSIARIPSATDSDGTIISAGDFSTAVVCGAKADAATTPLFDEEAATILNQRLPLRLLREATVSGLLAPNLRFELGNVTLTRAVLLDDPATVAAVSPVMAACQPAMKPWLDRYNAATGDPVQRHLQGLFLLMRFPSAEPLVRTGYLRPDGFATYSSMRDNWWSGNTQYSEVPNSGDYESGVHTVLPGSPKFKPALFTASIVPADQVASPPFVTAADAKDADREILALQHIPGAGDYFAAQTLDWVKAHPADANNVELLGFAMRVVRNASRTDATKSLNQQLFSTLHAKYPNSDWAKRYKTWE